MTAATPAADRARAAELMLAVLDGDPAAAAAIIDQADAVDGGVPGLITALVSGCVELLVGACRGDVEAARATLDMVLLNVEADGG